MPCIYIYNSSYFSGVLKQWILQSIDDGNVNGVHTKQATVNSLFDKSMTQIGVHVSYVINGSYDKVTC